MRATGALAQGAPVALIEKQAIWLRTPWCHQTHQGGAVCDAYLRAAAELWVVKPNGVGSFLWGSAALGIVADHGDAGQGGVVSPRGSFARESHTRRTTMVPWSRACFPREARADLSYQ